MPHTLFVQNGHLQHNFSVKFAGDAKATRWKRRASTDNRAVAKKEGALILAKAIEWQRIPDQISETPKARFSQALADYLKFEGRTTQTFDRFDRIARVLKAMGSPDPELGEFNGAFLQRMRNQMWPGEVKVSSVRSSLYVPMTALLNHAASNEWCDKPHFKLPRPEKKGDPLYFTPAEAERLIRHAAPHLQPLLIFMFGTGCRLSEALYLDWRDISLEHAIARLPAIKSKSGRRRGAELPPAVILALRTLGAKSEGPVFLSFMGKPYAAPKVGGGQIEHAFAGACARAGLGHRGFHPHCTRHSWATWHYAKHKDPMRLRNEGGWSSLAMVEIYAHVVTDCPVDAIHRVWGITPGLRVVV